MTTDLVEKTVLLRATRSKVWQALTDSKQFGSWFGVQLDGAFMAGRKVRGVFVPSTVESEGKAPHHGKSVEWVVDRVEPERLFSLRWHPYALDSAIDYAKEPMTLVTFTLKEEEGGVLLTVTESGFDSLPLARRADARGAHAGGWSIQLGRVKRFLSHAA